MHLSPADFWIPFCRRWFLTCCFVYSLLRTMMSFVILYIKQCSSKSVILPCCLHLDPLTLIGPLVLRYQHKAIVISPGSDTGRPMFQCHSCCSHGFEDFIHLSRTSDGQCRSLLAHNFPPVSMTKAWVKMFNLPISNLLTYFNALDEGFTKVTGSSLFHQPSSHDHASCALTARHNAVTTFSLR